MAGWRRASASVPPTSDPAPRVKSITSALQDKLPSTPIDFSTCGQINVVKKSDTGELLNGAKFQLYRSANDDLLVTEKIGGVCTTPGASSTIPPVAGNSAPATPTIGRCEWTELITPGTYWVVETEAPAGYTIDDDTVVGPINLAFRQTVTIDGTTNVDGIGTGPAGLRRFLLTTSGGTCLNL